MRKAEINDLEIDGKMKHHESDLSWVFTAEINHETMAFTFLSTLIYSLTFSIISVTKMKY